MSAGARRERSDDGFAAPDGFAIPDAPDGFAVPDAPTEFAVPTAPRASRWAQSTAAASNVGATPSMVGMTPSMVGMTPSMVGMTPSQVGTAGSSSRWGPMSTPRVDATPMMTGGMQATPMASGAEGATPVFSAFMGAMGTTAATAAAVEAATGGTTTEEEVARLSAFEKGLLQRILAASRFLTDEELDAVLPDGYSIVAAPAAAASSTSATSARAEWDAARAALETATSRHDLPEDGIISEALPPLRPQDAEVFTELLDCKDIQDDSDIPPSRLPYVHVQRALLRIKNGDAKQRRAGALDLQRRATHYGPSLLLPQILAVWRAEHCFHDAAERHRLVRVLGRVLLKFSKGLTHEHVQTVLEVVRPMLNAHDQFVRKEGREIIAALAKASGFTEMLRVLKTDIESDLDEVRRSAADVVAVMATALDTNLVMRFTEAVCRSKIENTRVTGQRMIYQIAAELGPACRRHLTHLTRLIALGVRDPVSKVSVGAANAAGQLADAVRPLGFEAFEGRGGGAVDESSNVLMLLSNLCITNRGAPLPHYLRAMGSIFALMPPHMAGTYAPHVMRLVSSCLDLREESVHRVALRAIDQCVRSDGISAQFLKAQLLVRFLASFWRVEAPADKRSMQRQIIDVTARFAKKTRGTEVLRDLNDKLERAAFPAARFFASGLDAVLDACGTVCFGDDGRRDDGLQHALMSTLVRVLDRDEAGDGDELSGAIVALARVTGRGFNHTRELVETVRHRLENPAPSVRRQGAVLLARVSPILAESGVLATRDTLRRDLRVIWVHMCKQVSERESDAAVVAASLRACGALMAALLADRRLIDDAFLEEARTCAASLLDAVRKALQGDTGRGAEAMQEQCVRLVLAVVTLTNQDGLRDLVPSDLLFRTATQGLFRVLNSQRRVTRTLTAQAFGEIAASIGPIMLVRNLLDEGLVKEDRAQRVCSEISLAIIAKTCSPFAVVPLLIHRYSAAASGTSPVTVQQAVLKALRFVFESATDTGDVIACIPACVPLLERALTERDPRYRRMACEVVRQMMLAAARGNEDPRQPLRDTWLHLLNFVVPNILDRPEDQEKKRVVTSVAEVFEAARLVLPGGLLLQMLYQGLFHPARRVREVYWNVYNSVLIGLGDAAVPFFPHVPNTDENEYARDILTTMV